MRAIRRLIVVLSSVVVLWVLASFAGAMLNPANAAFWTGSLMWSLLAGLSAAPAFLIIHHASGPNGRRKAPAEPKPFVDETARRETLRTHAARPGSKEFSKHEWPYEETGVAA